MRIAAVLLVVLGCVLALSCEGKHDPQPPGKVIKAEAIEFTLRHAQTKGHAVLVVHNLRKVDIRLDRTAFDPPCMELLDASGAGLSQQPCALPRAFDPATEIIVIHPNDTWEQEFDYQRTIDGSKDGKRARYIARGYGPMSKEAVDAGVLTERMLTNLLDVRP